jgi:hypothetical protein
MKKFLLQIFLFAVIMFASMLCVLFQADGYADPFYIRFTTKKQTSLILGTSRAAIGIQPQILNHFLNRNDFFNYSFTIGTSPYGPTFLNSIKQKLDTTAKNGIFILSVDPWGISSMGTHPNNEDEFEENTLLLATTKKVNINPNIQYLLKNFDAQYYKILFNKIPLNFRKQTLLHSDGWLEVITVMNTQQCESNKMKRIKEYKTHYIPRYSFSQTRLDYLIETIDFLSSFGKIYLVRLPVSKEILQIDTFLIPDFKEKMIELATQKNIPLLDFTELENSFTFSDGIHLSKNSGEKVSEIIAKWIRDASSWN